MSEHPEMLVDGPCGPLWCRITKRSEDGSEQFRVINGLWDGVFKDGVVVVIVGNSSVPDCRVLWRGRAPFQDDDYNEAIQWIEQQLTAPDQQAVL